jgi:hypothetical protein
LPIESLYGVGNKVIILRQLITVHRKNHNKTMTYTKRYLPKNNCSLTQKNLHTRLSRFKWGCAKHIRWARIAFKKLETGKASSVL